MVIAYSQLPLLSRSTGRNHNATTLSTGVTTIQAPLGSDAHSVGLVLTVVSCVFHLLKDFGSSKNETIPRDESNRNRDNAEPRVSRVTGTSGPEFKKHADLYSETKPRYGTVRKLTDLSDRR